MQFYLERIWAEFTHQPIAQVSSGLAEEIEAKTFREGVAKQILVNAYERSAEARLICLKRYGTLCSVCGFDFKKFYGEIGNGFIHVHHLKSLAEIKGSYELDPIKDLRPVCPNCHSMLHKKTPPYTIEDLKSFLSKKLA